MSDRSKDELQNRDSLISKLADRCDAAKGAMISVPGFKLRCGHGTLTLTDVSTIDDGNLRICGYLDGNPFTLMGFDLDAIHVGDLDRLVKQLTPTDWLNN